MLSNRATNNSNTNNQHRRQWSDGVVSADRSSRLYKDDDRQLIHHLVNEYLLEGSTDVLDLIRNCSNECFEALIDFIWHGTSPALDSNEDDLLIYSQRSSLLSSLSSNVHRQGARRRLAILFIEIFKLLATQTSQGGRFDLQRQQRLTNFPTNIRQLITFEPDIHGLSCLTLASVILINPLLIHHQLQMVFDGLKYAANQFVKADLSFETPSTFAVSIYSLFYLLYILYPNNLRRELQIDLTSQEKSNSRLGIEKVLLPLLYYFKLQTNIVCSSVEIEKQDNRWQNESWQPLIANGDRYVVSDDMSPFLSNDFRKRKDDEMKNSSGSNGFEIDQIIGMCNDYAESVLYLRENSNQIVDNATTKTPMKKTSTDCYSNYSDACCHTYEQQWQTTIQNGQLNLSRVQTPDEIIRHQTNGISSSSKKENKTPVDHNIHAKVQLQLDMLDCNYEQDKREYYAHLIRDLKKTMPIDDLEKELRRQESLYDELSNQRERKCEPIHDVRNRINSYHQMNEAFYDSLSATQVELKTDEDKHWQQRTTLTEKHSKIQQELNELEQSKITLENDLRDIQRRIFQSKQDAQQSMEFDQMIEKLSIQLLCARKKHQLLHNALLQLKLKPIDAEKLIVIHQSETTSDSSSIDEKKKKFQEFKQLIDRQHFDLTTKRNHFHQTRLINTHQINIIRRQIDSIHVCQTQLMTMNTNSQITDKLQ